MPTKVKAKRREPKATMLKATMLKATMPKATMLKKKMETDDVAVVIAVSVPKVTIGRNAVSVPKAMSAPSAESVKPVPAVWSSLLP